MNRFARDIIIAFLSDSNSAQLKQAIMSNFMGNGEVNGFLDKNMKRMQMSFSHYIERDFANVDPIEGMTVRDHVAIYNVDFVNYAVKEIGSEILPDLVPDYSVYERLEKRNMRRPVSADEMLASWYDNPAPLDQYRDDPQACKGGAGYNPKFDNIEEYAAAVKGTPLYCGSASSDYGLRQFDPRNTWRSPGAPYPQVTSSDNSKYVKYSSDKSFNPNANTWDTFVSNSGAQNGDNFVVGGHKVNERYVSGPPVGSECNRTTRAVFATPRGPFGSARADQFTSSPPMRYKSCGGQKSMPVEGFNDPANTVWRCNSGRIPDGGAGINFCDQSNIGGSLSYDMQFQTMYMQQMNQDPEPHTFQPFGWACPESDNRLLSRRIFRNNEAGVENGIPRYEQRLQRRNLDRDINEDLRDTQFDYQQRGHDMSDLWKRTTNKKHVIDANRDKLDITDRILYDSLNLREGY